MRYHRRNPSGDETYAGYARCKFCGTLNEIRATPRGGRYAASFAAADGHTNPATGGDVMLTTHGCGCDFCGSPEWMGKR